MDESTSVSFENCQLSFAQAVMQPRKKNSALNTHVRKCSNVEIKPHSPYLFQQFYGCTVILLYRQLIQLLCPNAMHIKLHSEANIFTNGLIEYIGECILWFNLIYIRFQCVPHREQSISTIKEKTGNVHITKH
jgi:hypothetical protein